MSDLLKNLSINGRLALVAFVLGFVALFAGSPYVGAGAMVNAKDLSLAMATDADQVDVGTLADWIIQGKSNFRVVDLRTEAAYAEYHIPPAENIPVAGLAQSSLLRNEKVILYAEGGPRAAQAWMLLKAKGFKGVYILRGGLEAWKDHVLFPRIPATPTPAQVVDFARAREVSKYFGGTPQAVAGDSAVTAQAAMPTLAMPTPQAAGAGAPKKKKKEGC